MAHPLPKRADLLTFKPGSLIGPFRLCSPVEHSTSPIVRPLGQGGSGVVFLAEQQLHGSVWVRRALKFFAYRDDIAGMTHHEESGIVGHSSFLEEITNIASFTHENILKAITAGTWTSESHRLSVPYLVTELISGPTLREFVESEEYRSLVEKDNELVFTWMDQLLCGVQHLHKHRFYHCDIATKNIFVKRDGNDSTIILGDLGVGRSIDSIPPEITIVGTRSYCPTAVQDHLNQIVTKDVFLSMQPTWDYYSACKCCLEMLGSLDAVGPRRRWLVPLRAILTSELDTPSSNDVTMLRDRIGWLRPSLRTTVDIAELNEGYRGNKQVLLPVENVVTSKRIRKLTHHPCMLRLKKVHQLQMGPAVFAGATHSRYEHSLGTYQVMRRYLTALLDDETFLQTFGPQFGELALLSALLSNIHCCPGLPAIREIQHGGSGYFKSITRTAIWAQAKSKHVDSEAPLAELIAKHFPRVDTNRLDSILGESPRTTDPATRLICFLLNSSIDCRVLDYLRRDSLHLGIDSGHAFDIGELLSHVKCREGAICVTSAGLPIVEQIVTFRYGMYNRVYWNKPHRCMHAMLSTILIDLAAMDAQLESDYLESCLSWSDAQFLNFLAQRCEEKGTEGALELCMLLNQDRPRLFEQVFQVNRAESDAQVSAICDALQRKSSDDLAVLREAMDEAFCEKFKIEFSERFNIIIDVPREPGSMKLGSDLNVITYRNDIIAMTRLSKIVDGANAGFVEHLQRIRVFLHPDAFELLGDREDQIERFCRDYLLSNV